MNAARRALIILPTAILATTVAACGGAGSSPTSVAETSAATTEPVETSQTPSETTDAAVAADVTIEAPTTSFIPSQQAALAATVLDDSGEEVDATISWSSSDDAVATVSTTGEVTAEAPGTATISATADDVSGEVDVTVLDSLELLTAPFDGEFPHANFFDHDVPQEHVDDNGVFATHWGERLSFLLVDGHAGHDWLMPEGTPILAAADGTVFQVFDAASTPSFFCPPLERDVEGQLEVQVRHTTETGAEIVTGYVHLSRIDVEVGQEVAAGDQIGLSGNTGCSTEAHLHFHVFHMLDGQLVIFDPYGWAPAEADPWAGHPAGAPSLPVWRSGEAPALFREFSYPVETLNTYNSPVAITRLRWIGIDDAANPNNEFVLIEADPRFATAEVDLSGFLLHDAHGTVFTFPAGAAVAPGQPLRVYSGAGTNTATELYWGSDAPVWDNEGDCPVLRQADGTFQYWVGAGACPAEPPSP